MIILICYADVLTNINLNTLISTHMNNNKTLTMALFNTNKPNQCGIVELDQNNVVVDFEEKPIKPKSNLANAGIYVANRRLLKYIPKNEVSDLGKDIIPNLINDIVGVKLNGYIRDIGTLDNLKLAREDHLNGYI